MFVGIAFITTLIRYIVSILYKKRDNGDIFLSQKSMQVADEKLIMNTLGSYMAIKSIQAGQVRPEQFYANQTCT